MGDLITTPTKKVWVAQVSMLDMLYEQVRCDKTITFQYSRIKLQIVWETSLFLKVTLLCQT